MSRELKGEGIMSRFKKILLVSLLSMFASTVWASEVYIDQTGSNTTIDITQTGTSNTVSGDIGSTTASVLSGSGLDVDISQIGDYNEAEINLLNNATGTILDYAATGSYNIVDVLLDGAADSSITAAVNGDYNRLSVCGINDGTASTSTGTSTSGPSCSSGITANDTTNGVVIGGDANVVNLQVGSAAGTTNSITIGDGLVASSENIVDVTQNNVDVNHVTLTIDGSSNVVGIVQN